MRTMFIDTVSEVILYLCISIMLVALFFTVTKRDDREAVKSYNDGFATSKQDDCQQGFQPACKWLGETR